MAARCTHPGARRLDTSYAGRPAAGWSGAPFGAASVAGPGAVRRRGRAAQADALLDLGVAAREGALVRLFSRAAAARTCGRPRRRRSGRRPRRYFSWAARSSAIAASRMREQALVADACRRPPAPRRAGRRWGRRAWSALLGHLQREAEGEVFVVALHALQAVRRRPRGRGRAGRRCVYGNSCRKSRRRPLRSSGSTISAKPWFHSKVTVCSTRASGSA